MIPSAPEYRALRLLGFPPDLVRSRPTTEGIISRVCEPRMIDDLQARHNSAADGSFDAYAGLRFGQ